MTRRLHHAHTANSHDRGSDSFDRGQTGGIADVVVGLDHHLGGQQLVRGKVAIGRPVTAIGFRRGRGCRGFVPADRHPRERDHHDEYEHTAGYQYRRRPARHMCAESPKLALYALVLWRFEEVGTAGQRDELASTSVRPGPLRERQSSKGFRLLRTYRSVPGSAIPQRPAM